MKTIFVLLLLFGGYTLQESNNNEHPIKVSIELPDTIYKGQEDIPIILKVENTTSEVLSIRNPARWGNAYPFIRQEGMNISMKKVNPGMSFYDVIQINGNETLRIKYSHTFDKIFSLGFYPSGKYEIYFEYYYKPKEKSKKMKFRKNKGVVDDGFVTSNVFTFYLLDKEQYFSVLLRQNLLNGIR